jgi:hypothetical protein
MDHCLLKNVQGKVMSPALGLNGAFVNRSGDDKCFREKSWKECSKKSQFRAANESGSARAWTNHPGGTRESY